MDSQELLYFGGMYMTVEKQRENRGVAAKMDAFNDRLSARIKRNHELLKRMHEEKDFSKVVQYMKAFFSFRNAD